MLCLVGIKSCGLISDTLRVCSFSPFFVLALRTAPPGEEAECVRIILILKGHTMCFLWLEIK